MVKTQGWKDKLLSQASREVLLKAVVQAIPTYSMNCFKLTQTLCPELETNNEGGMGFRDLQKFNDAICETILAVIE